MLLHVAVTLVAVVMRCCRLNIFIKAFIDTHRGELFKIWCFKKLVLKSPSIITSSSRKRSVFEQIFSSFS